YTLRTAVGAATSDYPLSLNVVDTTPPPPPVLAYPNGNISRPDATCQGSRWVLEWKAATDPNGISRYDWRIWTRSTSPLVPFYVVKSGSTPNITTPIPSELVNNVVYYWQVRSVDGAGNPGPYSDFGAMSFRILPCVG